VKPDPRFLKQDKTFWANVRTVSQHVGYTVRGKGLIKVPTLAESTTALEDIGLSANHIVDLDGRPTKLGRLLHDYFSYRADTLNATVKPLLMDGEEARALYEQLRAEVKCLRLPPMNKQSKEKKQPAYLTAIVNMLIEANAGRCSCDFDPRILTTITKNGTPLRTFARRLDGAFPAAVNPVAVWEIKEYYYTTTFGSRVSDGVYETLLDGMEIEELREHEGIDVKHYLIADARFTWWVKGKSYLCRIVDMLHMGYVDEVLFGREVVDRVPALVKEWVKEARRRKI
jgi:hypothetical protein